MIEAKAIYELSIGFNPTSYWISDAGIRIIEEVDLWEVSLVTFPANRSSVVTELRCHDILLSQMDKYLDEALAILPS